MPMPFSMQVLKLLLLSEQFSEALNRHTHHKKSHSSHHFHCRRSIVAADGSLNLPTAAGREGYWRVASPDSARHYWPGWKFVRRTNHSRRKKLLQVEWTGGGASGTVWDNDWSLRAFHSRTSHRSLEPMTIERAAAGQTLAPFRNQYTQ